MRDFARFTGGWASVTPNAESMGYCYGTLLGCCTLSHILGCSCVSEAVRQQIVCKEYLTSGPGDKECLSAFVPRLLSAFLDTTLCSWFLTISHPQSQLGKTGCTRAPDEIWSHPPSGAPSRTSWQRLGPFAYWMLIAPYRCTPYVQLPLKDKTPFVSMRAVCFVDP